MRATEIVSLWVRAVWAWTLSPPGRRVALLLGLLFAGGTIFAAYEVVWLDLPLVREEPPGFAPYQLAETAFAVILSGLLIAALVAAPDRPNGLDSDRCGRIELVGGLLALAAAAAALLLFLVDPAGFHAFAQEDRPLEWASALLLLGAGLLLAANALRRPRDPPTLALAAGLCLALVVIGMEEISWGQRLFGFATPDRLAELNWQAEFNLHNMQTDLSEMLYYVGAAVFLTLLPLLRDLPPATFAAHRLFALVPRRSVALVGAPAILFGYGHWNLLPTQITVMLAVCALLAWAWFAVRRGDRVEAAAFLAAAAAVLIGRLLLLAHGSAMIEVPDATEYKEFFIALGFAWYAATVAISPGANRR
jgi:hypothetical protein